MNQKCSNTAQQSSIKTKSNFDISFSVFLLLIVSRLLQNENHNRQMNLFFKIFIIHLVHFPLFSETPFTLCLCFFNLYLSLPHSQSLSPPPLSLSFSLSHCLSHCLSLSSSLLLSQSLSLPLSLSLFPSLTLSLSHCLPLSSSLSPSLLLSLSFFLSLSLTASLSPPLSVPISSSL